MERLPAESQFPEGSEGSPSPSRLATEGVGTSHQNQSYQQPQLFPCQQCHNVYHYQRNLLRHIRLECGKPAQIECPYCKYRSKHRADMMRHVRIRHRVPVTRFKGKGVP
ncbi:longitudinals lacking protein, isoforms A/B/D/L-like isoform X1 [Schistocerca piceifrons]|uniref:longitudinals lacking protein, isoforms A/B/D/L-like isoform X1 n=1 Tax=Schistocerca piceifrons TaxID=274613 RepID=UPI001F5FB6AD|nr:longitudinals lacking protein, isoforms A/B/D/L-like isoform X1 [Schistocerca piceifrons]